MQYCNKSKTEILVYNDLLRLIIIILCSIIIFNKISDFSRRSKKILNTLERRLLGLQFLGLTI